MLKSLWLTAALSVAATAAAAQDYTGLLDSGGELRGRLHAISAAPGESGITPVTVRVPLAREGGLGFGVLIDERPSDGGMVAFSFHTPDRELIEAVHLSTATIPTDMAISERLETFGALMQERVWPVIQAQYPGATTDGLQPVAVGDFPAIEMLGRANHPEYGPIRWRVVGIPNPGGEASVYALVQVATDKLPLAATRDFDRSLSGTLLQSLQFN